MNTLSTNAILPVLIAWLRNPDEAAVPNWDATGWQHARRVVFMHGIGPYLHTALPASRLYAALPADFRGDLASAYTANAERIQRMLGELEAILQACGSAGVEVMPLKGGLFAAHYLPDPAVRPMADLDLLIHPGDRQAMAAILTGLGYRLIPPEASLGHHDTYNFPGSRVASWHTEHRDNPRPVEVHTGLSRILWGGLPTPDLADHLWDSASPIEILGQRAWAPSELALLAYLSLHALAHLVIRTGRLIQWLDLAMAAERLPQPPALPYPNLTLPAMVFAARAMPDAFQVRSDDFSRLGGSAAEAATTNGAARSDGFSRSLALLHPRIRRWCETTPLDSRCGLADLRINRPPSRWHKRWIRWHPTPLRLALSYGQTPLPMAFGRYLARTLQHATGFISATKAFIASTTSPGRSSIIK